MSRWKISKNICDMKLLLDTHSFIWFAEDSVLLPKGLKAEIENPANEIFLRIASLWEMAIKTSIGKLTLQRPYHDILQPISNAKIEIIPITFEHTLVVSTLPFHHRDPFDRIIIAQCLVEEMVLMSKDNWFEAYGVKCIAFE